MRGLCFAKIGGDTTNKPCGIGSVGFPRPLLPVAIGAVSLENVRRVVSDTRDRITTESTL